MTESNLYKNFIEKLRKEKSREEFAKFIEGIVKLGTGEIYTNLLIFLTDEDLKEINDETSDEKADILIRDKFKLRTGKTPEDFANGLLGEITKNYKSIKR